MKGSTAEFSCSRNLNRWLNEHSSCSHTLVWYVMISCQPENDLSRQISYKLGDRDGRKWLLHIQGRRTLHGHPNFQATLLWQKLQMHLLWEAYQPAWGGLGGKRARGWRQRRKREKGDMKAEHLLRIRDWQCYSFTKGCCFWRLVFWYFMVKIIKFCYKCCNILQFSFCYWQS